MDSGVRPDTVGVKSLNTELKKSNKAFYVILCVAGGYAFLAIEGNSEIEACMKVDQDMQKLKENLAKIDEIRKNAKGKGTLVNYFVIIIMIRPIFQKLSNITGRQKYQSI